MKKGFGKRLVSLILCAAMLVTMVPDLTPATEKVKKMADYIVPDLRGLLEYLK